MMPLPFMGSGSTMVLIMLASVLLIVSSIRPQYVDGLRLAISDTFTPILKLVTVPVQTAAFFVRDVSGLAEMQSENARLKDENARLRDWYHTALLLEAENKSLRELLHVKLEPQHTYISARVLSDGGRTFAKSLLVDAGRADGVEKGQAVLAAQGVVGRVIEAGENTARILLITDINSRIPALVENSRLHAIFSGENKNNGRLLHLSPDSNLNDGARIITSGLGGVYPYGLPIGVVEKDQYNQPIVKPYADFNRLVYVRIVKTPSDPNLREGALNIE